MIQGSAFTLSNSGRDDLLSLPFFFQGCPLEKSHPRCHLTTAAAGSMRFRWNEENSRRTEFFRQEGIASPATGPAVPLLTFPATQPVSVPVELIHSQVVFALTQDEDGRPMLEGRAGSHSEALDLCRGDGLITRCKGIVPVVTVADCLPIFLYHQGTGCRGVVHSGWKGTGIVGEAIKLAEQLYGAKPQGFSVVIGPHIQSCCYQVEEERIQYFVTNFGSSCILPPNSLSLARANINLLRDLGVPEDNVFCCSDCTCCDPRLGSFRRETASLPAEMALEEKLRRFTTMMAFVR